MFVSASPFLYKEVYILVKADKANKKILQTTENKP